MDLALVCYHRCDRRYCCSLTTLSNDQEASYEHKGQDWTRWCILVRDAVGAETPFDGKTINAKSSIALSFLAWCDWVSLQRLLQLSDSINLALHCLTGGISVLPSIYESNKCESHSSILLDDSRGFDGCSGRLPSSPRTPDQACTEPIESIRVNERQMGLLATQ